MARRRSGGPRLRQDVGFENVRHLQRFGFYAVGLQVSAFTPVQGEYRMSTVQVGALPKVSRREFLPARSSDEQFRMVAIMGADDKWQAQLAAQ